MGQGTVPLQRGALVAESLELLAVENAEGFLLGHVGAHNERHALGSKILPNVAMTKLVEPQERLASGNDEEIGAAHIADGSAGREAGRRR